jgi:hypothetical protein
METKGQKFANELINSLLLDLTPEQIERLKLVIANEIDKG